MTAQDYNTVSLNLAPTSLGLVAKEGCKKQRQQLAHLANVLNMIEEELSSAKSGISSGGPSNNEMNNALSKLAGALQFLQMEIAQYAAKQAGSETVISKAELEIARQNLDKANKLLAKMAKQEKTQKWLKPLEKIIEGATAAVLTVVGVATAQPELLVAAALCFAGATGLLSLASEGVASLLELAIPSMSSDLAKVIAGALVTVVVIGATAGVAAIADVEAGAAAVTNGVTDIVDGVELSDEVVESSEGLLSNLRNLLGQIDKRAQLTILSGVQSASQTGAISDLTGLIVSEIVKASGKKDADQAKQTAEMVAAIVMTVLSVVATLGMGSSLAGAAGTASATSEEVTGLSEELTQMQRLLKGFREFGQGSEGLARYRAVGQLAAFEQTVASIANGSIQVGQAFLELGLTKCQAATALDNSAIAMNNNVMKSSKEFVAQREKQFRTSNRAINSVLKGEEAFSTLLCSSMV